MSVVVSSPKKTILVDVDLRRPTVHKKLNIPNEKGLTTALQHPELPIEKIFYQHTTDNLRVMTSGALPPNPSELLGSQRMKTIIAYLKDQSEMVIFDSTPVLPVADATLMSTLVDGVIMVLEPGVTKITAAQAALKSLLDATKTDINSIFNVLSDRSRPPDNELPDTGVDLDWERVLSSIFIASEHYGTRSSSVILWKRTGKIIFAERTFSPGVNEAVEGGTRQFKLTIKENDQNKKGEKNHRKQSRSNGSNFQNK